MSIETSWLHATTDIPEDGLEITKTLSADEANELARDVDVLSIDNLDVHYRIRPRPAGVFSMTGKLKATLTQECVVSLDPIRATIDEPIDVEFRPPAHMPKAQEGEREALAVAEIEPIEHQKLMVGRVIKETLAASIDPFPRKDGAAFNWQDEPADENDEAATSPFAALAKLKQTPPDDGSQGS